MVAALCAVIMGFLMPTDGDRCSTGAVACPCTQGQPSDDGPVAKRVSCCAGEASQSFAASSLALLSDGGAAPAIAAERPDCVALASLALPRRGAPRPVTRGPPPKPRYLEHRTLLL